MGSYLGWDVSAKDVLAVVEDVRILTRENFKD